MASHLPWKGQDWPQVFPADKGAKAWSEGCTSMAGAIETEG